MSIKRLHRILRRWLLLMTIAALLGVGGLVIYRFTAALQYDYDDSLAGADLGANDVQEDTGITTIALFGVDTREGELASRSDCMMLLTIDNTRHKIKLISLMRDSRVTIKGMGQTKLCHAYTQGPAAAIRAINQNFGTSITEYATVDFGQMVDVIDAVGGVTLTVNEAERKETNKYIKEYCSEAGLTAKKYLIAEQGTQRLNGVQAMTFGRIRKGGTGDDWSRVERQALVLQALFDEVKTMDIKGLLKVAQAILPNTTTSLSLTEIAPLVAGAFHGGAPVIEHTRVPLDGEWSYSSSGTYIVYDIDKAAVRIRDYINDDVFPVKAA